MMPGRSERGAAHTRAGGHGSVTSARGAGRRGGGRAPRTAASSERPSSPGSTEKRDISRRRPPSNFPPRIRSVTLVLHKHATLHIILSFVSYDSISIGIIKINGSSVIRQTFSFGNHRLTNH